VERPVTGLGLTTADYVALVFFALAWSSYNIVSERRSIGRPSLNVLMNHYRLRWMLEMQHREVRIFDSSLLNTLQSGTAFFASTSLFALGAAATLMRSTDDALKIFSDLPLAVPTTRAAWESKCLILALICGYTFFKFAWSYRLFNYVVLLLGATPAANSTRATERRLITLRAAEMNIVAGRHFNRGQRALFFAVAYLGYFVSPFVLMGTTAVTLSIMWTRQFASDARAAVTLDQPALDGVIDEGTPLPAPQGAGNSVSSRSVAK
jgi:uncharacterized membrane protein